MTAKLRTLVTREVLDRRGENVCLADPGRTVHHGLEGWRFLVDVVVLDCLEDDALECLRFGWRRSRRAAIASMRSRSNRSAGAVGITLGSPPVTQ